MADILLLTLYTGAAGFVSWSVVRLLFVDRPTSWQYPVAFALFPVLIAITLTGLGAIGLLTPHSGGLVMVVLALALWIAGRKHGIFTRRGDGPALAGLTREALVGLAALVGVVLLPLAQGLLAGPRFGYDDYTYHAPYVTQWMLDGRISLLPFNYHAYFPFNAELFSLWFMLPIGKDTFVGLGGAYWVVAAATSVTALARSLGRQVEGALFAAALVLASSLVAVVALRFSANDLAGSVMIATTLVVLADNRDGRRWSEVLVAGLLVGFGLGTKLTLLPAVLVLAVWIAWGRRGVKAISGRTGRVVLFLAGVVVSTGYWYGRNWILTGNPFFPGAIAFFDGPLGATEQDATKFVTFLLTDPLETLRTSIPAMTNWPVILWLVAAYGYLQGFAAILRTRRSDYLPHREVEAMLFLVGMSLLLAFPFQPFSGSSNYAGAPLNPDPRFLVMSFTAGIVLASHWIVGVRGVLIAAVLVVAAGLTVNPFVAVLTAVLCLGAWFMFEPLRAITRLVSVHRRVLLGLLAMSTVGSLVLLRGNLEREIEQRIFSHQSWGRNLGMLWSEVAKLPPGSRIAALGHNFTYPLFGRSLNLRPVVLDRSGALLEPLHEIWKREGARFEWWAAVKSDSSELPGFAERLRSSGVTHVAVSRTFAGEWPVEAGVLLPPRFTVTYSDTGSALYGVNR